MKSLKIIFIYLNSKILLFHHRSSNTLFALLAHGKTLVSLQQFRWRPETLWSDSFPFSSTVLKNSSSYLLSILPFIILWFPIVHFSPISTFVSFFVTFCLSSPYVTLSVDLFILCVSNYEFFTLLQRLRLALVPSCSL